MKLLTKIIGKAPSELEADELLNLVKGNRARIRKEIREFRKLKQAIKESSPKRTAGKPKKEISTFKKKQELQFAKLVVESGVSMEDVLKELQAIKDRKGE